MDGYATNVTELDDAVLTGLAAGCFCIVCVEDHADESSPGGMPLRFIFTEITSSFH